MFQIAFTPKKSPDHIRNPTTPKKKRRMRITYDSSEDDDGEVDIIEKSPSPLSILMEAPSLPLLSTSKQSGNKFIDDLTLV